MKYEIILNIEVDPIANFMEVDDTESSRVVLELIQDIFYDVDDLQILKCEVTRYD